MPLSPFLPTVQVASLAFVYGLRFLQLIMHPIRPHRPLTTTADGNAKLTHFSKCGRSITAAYDAAGLGPLSTDFFGDNSEAAQDFIHGLTNFSTTGDLDTDAACQTHMRCANATPSKGSSDLDVKTTVGFLCGAHGVPLQGSFLSVAENECFPLYVTLLYRLAPKLPGLQAFVLDINCQFSKHVSRLYQG